MKKKILAGLLLAGSTMFAAPRVSFGDGFGNPEAAVTRSPGPGYVFVNGYWQSGGSRDFDRDDNRGGYYRGGFDRDDNRGGYDRGGFDRDDNRGSYSHDNDDRRAPEHVEHFDRQSQQFRR